MADNDTVRLLRECDAGVKMGVSSLSDVIDRARSPMLESLLAKSRLEHENLADEARRLLSNCGDSGKEPNPMAKSMAKIKTDMKLAMNDSDATIAGLISSGCAMGVKSLSRYLDQYPAAGSDAKALAQKVISVEEKLAGDLRKYMKS